MRISNLRAAIGLCAALTLAVPAAALGQRAGGRDSTVRDTATVRDTTARDSLPGALRIGNLGLDFRARIETKGERTRNERCTASQLFSPLSSCRGRMQPSFDVQFALRSAGTFGDRFGLDIDYDTQREFDASNNLSVFYQGQEGERIQRVELGNVSFSAPASRYITSNIPSGNYGLHAVASFGPFRVRTIAAQQKGNVAQTRTFTVGDRTLQQMEREIADHQIEPRRFFFTVDPARFTDYPRIDILDRAQMERLRTQLPDTLRPTRVLLYRLQFGAQPQNPNGPRFRLLGDASTGRQTYDVLREGVDYYMDPSLLWFALVRPLNASNERLVVAYNVRVAGRDTIWTTTGGTPDLSATPTEQYANLVWDPSISPQSPAFRSEIRSVYRIAGGDLQRRTLRLRVLSGVGDQEKPLAASWDGRVYDTYLQMLGLAQTNNSAELDVETRIWPRESDPILDLSVGAGDVGGGASATRVVQDYFLVMPALRPFAARDSGLIVPGNPVNDTIYKTPGEFLYSQQHPPALYRLQVHYQSQGSDAAGSLSLGVVQLRPGSDRIRIDGRDLVRGVDYQIDYDLGRVRFARADTLFLAPRRVTVSYEENPLFAPSPTTLFGLVTEVPMRNGQLAFTAISQSQKTSFTRPQLGFEPVSTILAGVSGRYQWNAPALTRLTSGLTFGATAAPSRIAIQGEVATSRPQPNRAGTAYIEAFEGDGGVPVPTAEDDWYYSSMPAYGDTLRTLFPADFFGVQTASTLVWQNNPRRPDGSLVTFSLPQIDSLANLADAGFAAPEQILWLTLFPLNVGGRMNRETGGFDWRTPDAPVGTRRWRSIRTVLSPSGVDLTRGEYLEFWTLVDTAAAFRSQNPTLVFDLGDVSENSLTFAPDTILIARSAARVDSTFRGKRVQGIDSLDTERDPLSRGFNVAANDNGLPGDVADTVTVIEGTSMRREANVPICLGTDRTPQRSGDPRSNCTRGNSRLDEEDIDLDNALNFDTSARESERLLRFVVDLSDTANFSRVGREADAGVDTVGGVPVPRRKQWVLVRVPFTSPDDSLNDVQRRRIRALRLTIVSGTGTRDDQFVNLPINRLRIAGPPWLKRGEQTLAGLGGEGVGGGFVLTGLIGTADRDSLRDVDYESPPGVREQLESGAVQTGQVIINEKSLRILAGNLPVHARAEAYYRFPSGDQNFMGYEELRLWGRGRNRGWGENGELQMLVKVGRDENNFYAYRTPVNAGRGQATWLPEVRVRFEKFYELRRRLQNAWLQGTEPVQCTGADSALVYASQLPADARGRWAACDDGYIVYTVEPAATPPNLAAVQEVSVGIVRMRAPSSGDPSSTLPGDTLELWVDDIRLSRVVSSPGYAGQVALEMVAADFAEVRVNASRRDPNFRQLTQQPSFTDERALDVTSTLHLEKLLPRRIGIALPLTVTHTQLATTPQFLVRSDLRGDGIDGLRTPRTSQTVYALSLRKATPIRNPILGPLLNNLALTSSYVDGGARSEYQDGTARRFVVGLDFVATDTARTVRMPGALDRLFGLLPDFLERGPVAALRRMPIRWNPSRIQFGSTLTRANDRRWSFLKPADAPDDDPRLSLALTNLWRNGSTIEFRPVNALTLRWDATSVRDLRQYGDTNRAGLIASTERGRLFGMDVGLERERTMNTSASFAPVVSSWIRPRVDYGTTYSMLRDPNSRALVATAWIGDSTLPRRMSATQSLSGALTLDLPRAFTLYTGDSSVWRGLARLFTPIDVSVSRSLISSFDNAAFTPTLNYQLGFGGIEAFRRVAGANATTAGSSETMNASTTLQLPFRTAIVGRFRRTLNHNWIQRIGAEGGQARIDGAQTVFPDVGLRWDWRPSTPNFFVSAVGLNVGYSEAFATNSVPGAIGGVPPEVRRSHVRTYPVNASMVWAMLGNLGTSAGFTRTTRVDTLPGSSSEGNTDEVNLDVHRSFAIPRFLRVGSATELRTRVGWQRSRNTIHVIDAASSLSSRLADQGRDAISIFADTDLSPQMNFSLQASRVITYDNNANRRLSQIVLSTVLEIQFGGR